MMRGADRSRSVDYVIRMACFSLDQVKQCTLHDVTDLWHDLILYLQETRACHIVIFAEGGV